MNFTQKTAAYSFLFFLLLVLPYSTTSAQIKPEVLTGDNLKRVVPTSFYFAGQSAATQERNTAAAKFGENRFVIVGLVDTSGYSTEISGKYEGFFHHRFAPSTSAESSIKYRSLRSSALQKTS